MANNRLVLIGNGFDLAHGLKTSYKDFMTWYMCTAFEKFVSKGNYFDPLFEINKKYLGMGNDFSIMPETVQAVMDSINCNDFQSIKYNSVFFRKLIDSHLENKWVDIELFYFHSLKIHFLNPDPNSAKKAIEKLNIEFNFMISKLTEYIKKVNDNLVNINELSISESRSNLKETIKYIGENKPVKFLNFNYTNTILDKHYAHQEEVIHIHGQVSNIETNPIIFGYGDESDPIYQKIEDSGENIYLEHIKSFGYFQTKQYQNLLSFIDSDKYHVYIVGHSCGLSDRVLLNEIFENENCEKIDIYYHKRKDGTDNFKEITQEISRHFKPHNKKMMRRKLMDKNPNNFIPQIP